MPLRLMANSTLRDRIGQLIKNGYDFARLEILIIGISTFLVFVVTAANLFTHEVSGFTRTIDLPALKSLLPILLAGIVSVIVLLTSITYLMIAVRDRSKEVAHLKLKVRQAYSKALEQSSFNPHLVEPHHEQPSP